MSRRLLVAALLFAAAAAAFAFKASRKMPDFEVYWRAGARAAAAEPLYRVEDQHYQFKYLPAFAVLVAPASLLPLGLAKALWFAISILLVAALLRLSLDLLPGRRYRGAVLVTATLVLMAKFYAHELVLGQVNLLLGVSVLAGVLAVRSSRPILGGILLALAVVIKPYAIVMGLWLIARRDARAIAAATLGGLAVLALPVLVYGPAGAVALHRDWWHTVSTSTAPNLLNADNVSLAAMFAKWIGAGPLAARLAAVSAAALLLVSAIVLALRRRAPQPDGLDAALLLTLVPLLSPQGWDYVFLLSTPAVMLLVDHARDLPAAMRIPALAALVTIGFSIYDLLGRQLYAQFMALSAISACYLVVVAALATLRVRGTA